MVSVGVCGPRPPCRSRRRGVASQDLGGM